MYSAEDLMLSKMTFKVCNVVTFTCAVVKARRSHPDSSPKEVMISEYWLILEQECLASE